MVFNRMRACVLQLHAAAVNGQLQCVQFLMHQVGICLESERFDGSSALWCAAAAGHLEVSRH